MEKTDAAAIVPLDTGWNDVGSWSALWETAKHKDANNNVIIGDAMLDSVHNNYINSEQLLIAVVGLDDVVVVVTKERYWSLTEIKYKTLRS
jgi:mannose-1-phosphate guanylyltransferase